VETKSDYFLSQSVVENNTVLVTGVSGTTQLEKVYGIREFDYPDYNEM